MSDEIGRETKVTLRSKYHKVEYETSQDEIYLRDSGGAAMIIERQAINTLLIMLTEVRDAD